MARSNNFYILASLLVILSFVCLKAQAQDQDITQHGGVADGKTDSAPALLAAFTAACASPTPSNIVIPKGDFFMSQVVLNGPCKSTIGINLQGNLIAPTNPITPDPKSDWFNVRNLVGLNVFGGGSMNGQGKQAWDRKLKGETLDLMAMFSMSFVTNGDIRDVTFTQSKNTHVHLYGCKNVTFTKVTIDSPDLSPNTDGIKMGVSSDISILDSTLKSGDDCVAILSGTERLTVVNTNCGPGHGMSVGSMGGTPNEKDIVGVHITNCTFTGTMNGVRLKSWQDKFVAAATDVKFEDIIMVNVGNPIIIDQEYCPAANCGGKAPSKVKISKVAFTNIRGSSSTENAVKLTCSQLEPCKDVTITDINLTFNGGKTISSCTNVQPILSGVQNPQVCSAPVAPAPAPVV
ncbi:hypothetical protein LIER_17885 [Lithospermum erythrorhizon]|uniref:Polygalacturonase n=1 Tax=Lithospermum erythrorhizon TaxID=34254 RepID=A0AAV3QDR7_LITER